MSPPKFHYAKNSDEPLSGRFSQQRLRESSRVSSPWRRGYFSGLTQVFPHRRVLAGRHLKCIDKWKLASRLSLHLELKSRTPICIFNSIPFFLHFQQFIYAPGTQHWVSEFHTFDDAPEVFATYQLRNNKSNRLYTDKFSIYMIDSTRIDLATEEDKYYEIDR